MARPSLSKSIDTLVEDIQGLFEGHGFSDALGRFSDDLGKSFQERFKSYAEQRQPTLRVSNYGRPLRQLWYELSGYTGEILSASTRLKFLYGDILEGLLLLLAAEAGHTVEGLQQEVNIDGVIGHADAIIDGTVVDVKSASTFSYGKFRDGSIRTNDPFGYIPQLAGYSLGLGGLPGAFLVVDKTLGHIHLEKFSREELSAYPVQRKIADVRFALTQKEPPEKCYPYEPFQKSGNEKISIGCSYCPYKFECHKDCNNGEGLKAYNYYNGITYLSKVVKEPRVQQENMN